MRGSGRHGGDGRTRRAVGVGLAGALLASMVTGLVTASPVAAVTGFSIFDGSRTAPILLDASYGADGSRDHQQVRRAVQDLRQDVAMVSGAIDAAEVQALTADDEAAQAERLDDAGPTGVPELLTEVDHEETAIIVGQVGRSDLLDQVVEAGKFDEAAALEGEWEAFAVKVVQDPLPGVDEALVIAGSDARGTIYGIYSISEEIGVSPRYWFSDVPVVEREQIVVDAATRVDDGPDVRYRGIFINDEERTVDWAKKKFPTDGGSPDVNYYRHVFEMMLRHRLNTLWPAMHLSSTAFNATTDTGTHDTGTPVNAREASAYGIVASSSHAELMLRNNEGEWRQFYARNKAALDIKGADAVAAYDYSINKPVLIEYWRQRVVANAEFENIFALGIRGLHDSDPVLTANNPYGFTTKVQLVADAIAEQRELIAEVYGSEDAVPQVFIPYKEMGDLYNAGLKAFIPDDVTLMWAEDNQGYLRQTPTPSEAAREGGNGVYYHISYWGEPKSYLWLNSTPMALMVQQLHRAWNTNARRYWVLNVGDIKPGEMKLDLFARLAWDVDDHDVTNLADTFVHKHVRRDFGLDPDDADRLTDALMRFDRLESTKRAEFWGELNTSSATSGRIHNGQVFPFSPTADGDELQRYINEAADLVAIVREISDGLDPAYRSAFHQQVRYRFESYLNMAEQIGYFWKNQLAAQQGRHASASSYELLSKRARARIFSDQTVWNAISDGKWDSAIGHSHPEGFPNEGTVMLTNDRYATMTSPTDRVGAAAEGSRQAGVGTLRFSSAAPEDERFFDVFSRDEAVRPQEWVAEADAPWIRLSTSGGTVATEERVTVTVAAGHPAATGTIKVYDAVAGAKVGDPVATFAVEAVRAPVDLQAPSAERGHLETYGYVALEAEHFAQHQPGSDGSRWDVVPGVGQRGASMGSFPETAPRVDSAFGSTARLRYRVYFTSTGQFTGTYYRLPTLNEGNNDNGVRRTARTAIGLDGQVPGAAQLLGNSVAGAGVSPWGNNIMRGIEPLTFSLNVTTPGWHDVVVYRADAAIMFDRIVIETSAGAVGDGLVGPPESPNNIAPRAAAVVAPIPAELPQVRRAPAVETVVGAPSAVPGVEGAVSATSDNETAVTATVEGGIASLVGRRPGTSLVTVAAAGGVLWEVPVTVRRSASAPGGAYQERAGRVVVDTADALERSAEADATPGNNGTHAWALGRNGVQVVPPASGSAKAQWLATTPAEGQALLAAGPAQRVNGSSAAGAPPRLSFVVDVETAGDYRLFANMSNPNADADSYHVYVDGQWRYTSAKGGEETGAESWYGSPGVAGAAMRLEPGRHTITVAAREAGIVLNQLVLTTEASPQLAGFLEPSRRGSRTVAPTVTLAPVPTTVEVGRTAAVTVAVDSAAAETPTGAVTLTVAGAAPRTAQLQDGAATFTVGPFAAAGSVAMTASYAGDGGHDAGEGTGVLTVVGAAPIATSVSASAGAVVYGAPGRVAVSVTPAGATGRVEVLSGSTVLGAAVLAGGRAEVALPRRSLRPGRHQLTVRYAGDGSHGVSASVVPATVAKSRATLSIKAPKSVARGTAPVVRIRLVAANDVPITGKVRVTVGGGQSVTRTVRGGRTIAVTLPRATRPGRLTVGVAYSGSALVAKATGRVAVRVGR